MAILDLCTSTVFYAFPHNFVNNSWILLKLELYVIQVKAIIFHHYRFEYIQNGRRYDVITENYG